MNVEIPIIQVLILGVIFDACLLIVVVAHIKFVSRLSGQIMALEASTDMLLQSQTELTRLFSAFLSK